MLCRLNRNLYANPRNLGFSVRPAHKHRDYAIKTGGRPVADVSVTRGKNGPRAIMNLAEKEIKSLGKENLQRTLGRDISHGHKREHPLPLYCSFTLSLSLSFPFSSSFLEAKLAFNFAVAISLGDARSWPNGERKIDDCGEERGG